jgi:hypothetical protein
VPAERHAAGADPFEIGVGVMQRAETVSSVAEGGDVEWMRARRKLADVEPERREGDSAGALPVQRDRK